MGPPIRMPDFLKAFNQNAAIKMQHYDCWCVLESDPCLEGKMDKNQSCAVDIPSVLLFQCYH